MKIGNKEIVVVDDKNVYMGTDGKKIIVRNIQTTCAGCGGKLSEDGTHVWATISEDGIFVPFCSEKCYMLKII